MNIFSLRSMFRGLKQKKHGLGANVVVLLRLTKKVLNWIETLFI